MRSRTRSFALALLAASPLAGCSSCSHRSPADAGPSASASASALPVAAPAPLSLPIAADHDAQGNVYVAGFVAARGALNLSRFDESGRLLWTVDVIDKAAFSPDQKLDVIPTDSGPVVSWRGIVAGKRSRVAKLTSADGKPEPSTFPIGSGVCAVQSALYWVGSHDNVAMYPLPGGPEKKVTTVGEGREPSILCGDTRAFFVDLGEDDVSARGLEGGKAGARAALVSTDELGDDEIREHETYTTGDTLGDLLLTEQGRLFARRYGDKLSPRIAIAHRVGADEDLMAVDGTSSRIVAILTRDAGSRCDGDTGTDVSALDVAVPEGTERLVDVAHGDCARDLGPYWVGPTSDAVYVAWNVRGPRNGTNKAPVEALSWARVDSSGAPEVKTIALSAEDVVFAGCAKTRCYFAALARPEGTDGMVPGAARVLTIP